MKFWEKFVHLFSNNTRDENKNSQERNFETQDFSDRNNSLNSVVDSDDNLKVISNNGDVKGRYVDDSIFKKETDEEQFIREQRKVVYRLEGIYIPGSAICSESGCGKKDTPLFIGKDGRYYCREHILPENRGK